MLYVMYYSYCLSTDCYDTYYHWKLFKVTDFLPIKFVYSLRTRSYYSVCTSLYITMHTILRNKADFVSLSLCTKTTCTNQRAHCTGTFHVVGDARTPNSYLWRHQPKTDNGRRKVVPILKIHRDWRTDRRLRTPLQGTAMGRTGRWSSQSI